MNRSLALRLASIRETLVNASSESGVAAARKFVPTSTNVYGVRMPVINALARKHKSGGFEIVQALWQSGTFEERLLAAKLLGAIAAKDPGQTLLLIEQFSSEINDWSVCDTIGMQAVKAIRARHEAEIIQLVNRLVRSSEMWQRRLAVVILTHYAKQPARRAVVRELVQPLRTETEHYIKKALAWLDRDLAAKPTSR
jgi:3-methyladenine DNA glycosylase AlkD